MRGVALQTRRRLLVPEVVQTSTMDCGPAALKCLLDGFGLPVSYGRLREACQTDVDGTSIDTLEDVAVQLGLEAEQIMLPVDYVLLPEAQSLPALVVVRLPDGNTHFVVAWRRHGRFVQLMDPGTGRRWPTCRQFLDALYVHTMSIPAAAWRAWAGSDECLDVLHHRLAQLGLSPRTTMRLLDIALEDQGWRSLATLDAALRMVTALVRAGGLRRGQQARRVLAACLTHTPPDAADHTLRIPAAYWSVQPAPPGSEGEEQLLLRGAVLVRIRGWLAVDHTLPVDGLSEPGGGPPPLSPELVAALEEPPSQPGWVLLQLLYADGLLTPTVLVAAVFLAAAGLVVEGLLWRSLIDLGSDLGLLGQRLGAMGMVLVFGTALLLLELGITGSVLRAGRRLEVRLRMAFLEKIPRLGDRYFHSRLTSDMAERSHSLHRIRLLPELGGQFLLVSCELVLTTVGIAWLDPASTPLAVLTAALAIGIPLTAQPLLAERDFRVRTHVGALSRFYLDTLLGLVAIRTHGAAQTLQGAHAQLLGEWTRAGVGLLRAVVTVEGVQFCTSFGFVTWLLFDYYGRGGEASVVLLLIYWALNLPILGQEMALLARQYPTHRNVTLRLLEPLGALEHQSSLAPSPLAGNGWDGGAEAMAAPVSRRASPPPLPSPIEGEGTDGTGSAIADLTNVLEEAARQTHDQTREAQAEDGSQPTQPLRRLTGTMGVALTLEGVQVRVAGQTVLAGIDLTIEAGSHVAIVGPSGAGKSSLVGTLLGWYRPATGEIRIDGVPLDGQCLDQLRRETTWVDPAVQLWNRSLLDNLSYGAPADPSLPFGQVIAQAHLHSVLGRLPDGLQTRLGEGGAMISGGEGQQVRLGRAMLRSGVRLVILDEPCRGLDREHRRELLARARQLWRQATLLCITHDVGETRAFDRVLVMEGGRIIEDGTPTRLAGQPQSRYSTLLEAEVAVQQGLWSRGRWRRLWLNEGRLVEDDCREYSDERSEATIVASVEAGRSHGGACPPERPFSPRTAKPLTPPQGLGQYSHEPLSQWLILVAGSLGLEVEAVMTPYPEVEWLVRGAGPALLRIPDTSEPRFLALLGSGRKVAVLGPDRKVHQVQPSIVCTVWCRDIEAPRLAAVDHMLDTAGVPPRRRRRARAAILREQLSATWIEGCWRLRLSRGASLWRQARTECLPYRLLALVGMYTVQYLLWLLAWWVIGRGALQGRFDTGSLLAWTLLLLTLIPCRLLATWWQGRLAISVGGLLKQWLLSGALRLDLEETRHQGAGQLLGRVIESDVVESLALSGGLLGLVASIELLMAPVILSAGAGGWGHALLLLGWVGGTGLLGGRYFRSRQRWTAARLEMTHDLVEGMVGHRTRLAQEAPEHWHDGEEQAIERYLALARAMDRRAALLLALVPRGWCVLGLLGLAPAFVSGPSTPVALAVGLGGTLLAYRALHKLAAGIVHLTGAVLAWQHIAPLVTAATHAEASSTPASALALTPPVGGGGDEPPLLEAHELVFRYRERGAPVLQGNSLRIHAGDRLLLAGPSGGGKSTFASLLTGLRLPESGLLLSRGLDLLTLGADGWRQRVVTAPQFHENHVLTGTFAFNLLLGRRWPPQPADLEEAEAVCRELGLGDLLDRMPAGLWQTVGETGWQLSHGERSRLYMARALLQHADVVILDESFAALDPENLQRALHCALTRASTLLVIAHP